MGIKRVCQAIKEGFYMSTVPMPLYKKWWFLALMLALTIVFLFCSALIITSYQKISLLEEELAELTEEKKEVLVEKNQALKQLEHVKMQLSELEDKLAGQTATSHDTPTAFSATLTNPIFSLDKKEVEHAIYQAAEEKYPKNKTMQEHAVKEQLESYEYLKEYEITSQFELNHLHDAMKAHPDDFTAMQMVFEEELKAYKY